MPLGYSKLLSPPSAKIKWENKVFKQVSLPAVWCLICEYCPRKETLLETPMRGYTVSDATFLSEISLYSVLLTLV